MNNFSPRVVTVNKDATATTAELHTLCQCLTELSSTCANLIHTRGAAMVQLGELPTEGEISENRVVLLNTIRKLTVAALNTVEATDALSIFIKGFAGVEDRR